MSQRHCLTLDLKNDPALIAEYKKHHQHVWPEILNSIHDSGILDMEIYLLDTRLFMIMEVADNFSFAAKQKADPTKSQGPGMGIPDVEVPASSPPSQAR